LKSPSDRAGIDVGVARHEIERAVECIERNAIAQPQDRHVVDLGGRSDVLRRDDVILVEEIRMLEAETGTEIAGFPGPGVVEREEVTERFLVRNLYRYVHLIL
jgi:hypothetical protein